MNFNDIVNKTRNIIKPSFSLRYLDETLPVQINITGENSGKFYIKLDRNQLEIEPYSYNDRKCLFTVSDKNYAAICDGSLDAVKAYVDGKIKIDGDINKALKFAGIIKSLIEQGKKCI